MRLPARSIACLALVLAPTLACSVETSTSHTGSANTATAGHDGWFEGSFDEGLKQARATSKLLFVDFNTTWCPPCRKLEKETFPDPAVKAEFAQMVAMSIDAESPAGREPAERYRVTGYPTMVVVDGNGREIGRIVGFKPPAELAKKLAEIRGRVKS